MNPDDPVTNALIDPSRPGPRVSLVIPAYREEENILTALRVVADCVRVPHEVLVVYDSEEDPTVPIAQSRARVDRRVRVVRNRFGGGRGLLNAIRTGIAEARGEAVVVTMADVTDDLSQVDAMWALHQQGFAIVTPSRHMRGGKKRGGPFLKSWLARLGGLSLRVLTGLPTSDPTNAFKLFDVSFLRETPIESTGGFEYSLELCAKAYLSGRRIAELPTSWHEREAGSSKFKLWTWLPSYMAWYGWLVQRTWRRRLLRRR